MADNVTAQSGTLASVPANTVIATDNIAGVDYQRVKVTWGVDGTATDVSATDPLPVVLTSTTITGTVAATQSGAWNVTNISGTVSLPTGAATAAKQPALGTAGTASADVISVQGIASMTALKVDGSAVTQPVSISGNQAANVAQLAGTTTDTNSGTKSAGTLRVVLATDQPQLTNKLLVTPDANSAVNVSQINGVTPLMGAGNTGTGSHRVTLATDQAALAAWGLGATGSAVPAGAQYRGGNAITSLPTAATAGNLTGNSLDKYGRQIVLPVTIRDLVGTQTTTISASTSETTIVTAAASVFNDLVMLIVSNTSASTNTRVDFRDTTSGTVLFSLQSNGGQPPVGFALPVPIPQTTVNTNWTAQCATSTTDVRVYAVFAKNR